MIKVYGSSDDLIEVEGDITEEFSYMFNGTDSDPQYLGFSDGTLLSIRYSDTEGVWRIAPMKIGESFVNIEQCPADDDKNYSDIAWLDTRGLGRNKITWVLFGSDYKFDV